VVYSWLLSGCSPTFTPEFGLIFDPPPFELQLTLSIIALPMTVGVLIKQNRQENWEQAQLSYLIRQKIAKLIALVERCDLPNIKSL